MTTAELLAAIERVRKHVPLRDRLRRWGRAEYFCSCGMGRSVQLCEGVGRPEFGLGLDVPLPTRIQCPGCDDQMTLVEGSIVCDPIADRVDEKLPYIRLPSRRAAVQMAREGRAEGQLVRP